ncbi:LemA family protein [Candidatus Sulfopaludibacter sp. SbA6]|nr:LemA family protein [Candidatus Sulfopaludibacter sp. SbA6]
MKTALIVVPVLVMVAIGFGAGRKYVNVRLDLMAQREAVSQEWAQVQVALQSRADLLPSLVETMQGAAEIGNGVFRDMADARAALAGGRSPQEKMQANDQLSAALGRLLVLSENYPQLRTNESFRRLQDAIAEKENNIAVERRKYNETLEHYNAQIQMFPDNVVASVSGFTRNDAYFPTEPGARSMPKVQ